MLKGSDGFRPFQPWCTHVIGRNGVESGRYKVLLRESEIGLDSEQPHVRQLLNVGAAGATRWLQWQERPTKLPSFSTFGWEWRSP
jgi:hypothetical protein